MKLELTPIKNNFLFMGLASLAMLAFTVNSLLTRAAFQTTSIDPASFSSIRILSGALVLMMILRFQGRKTKPSRHGWLSALALFAYITTFSFAYRGIDTGAGALILFASVQTIMIAYGYHKGERTNVWGLLLVLGGMVGFLSPTSANIHLTSAILMMFAGMAWATFSLVGKSDELPLLGTANSFYLAMPFALLLIACQHMHLHIDQLGVIYALISGGMASALGYAIWYWVRVRLTSISAALLQISVPLLSALLGVLLLDEHLSIRSAAFAMVIFIGLSVVMFSAKARSG